MNRPRLPPAVTVPGRDIGKSAPATPCRAGKRRVNRGAMQRATALVPDDLKLLVMTYLGGLVFFGALIA